MRERHSAPARSGKYDRPAPVKHDAMLDMPVHRAREHRAFDIAADRNPLVRRVRMRNALLEVGSTIRPGVQEPLPHCDPFATVAKGGALRCPKRDTLRSVSDRNRKHSARSNG